MLRLPKMFVSLLASSFLVTAYAQQTAQQTDLTQSPGLKRFNLESDLGSYSSK